MLVIVWKFILICLDRFIGSRPKPGQDWVAVDVGILDY